MASPSSMPRPPPLAPPSQRPLKHLPPAEEALTEDTSSSASLSLNPSLLIISAIIAFVFIASAFIHLLLRLLSSRLRSSSVAAAPPPPPLPLPPPSSLPRRSDSHSSAADSGFSDKDKAALVDSLPLFSLASSLSVLPKSSPDCAVCLCPFRPHDELRLLPACRHAFHSQCVDPWLRSAPSCPLCRASIALPAAPLPSSPPPPPQDASTTGSFRVEIGSVSRRGTTTSEADLTAGNHPRHLRTFSLGSSLEFIVDEEVEAVVAWIPRRTGKEQKREASAEPEPPQPAAEVAEAAGGGGRGWLRDHVDRLASSASSTLSSLQFSGRWSHRYDGAEGGRWSRDLEGSARREAEEGGYYDFYRWLVGA
ncbi:E3 ubiquitin-protein ligase ATL4-like [Curcuma longa]|uniref:E3 ubiquitin-protein ligase ATL4-like n=1 Tax=Curcuma longa TaxID=136217 RepID=UPI003D9F0407